MAFKDLERALYDGRVKLSYKDSSHRYSVVVDGVKQPAPNSVTTIMGDTLEKKGLQTWPMGLALRHLLGFYDFEDDDGNRKTGFSKDVGVLWNGDSKDPQLKDDLGKSGVLQHCIDAAKMWTDKQKAGADVGTLVHDAAEQHISGTPFDITVDIYREKVIEKEGPEAITPEWENKAAEEVAQANLALESFKSWWKEIGATVEMSEEILYSIEHNVAGTFDQLLSVPGKGLVLSDLKTTKVSVKAGAPQGVYYSYFIQLGIYALMLQEMGVLERDIQDMMIISARKDGGFDTIYASQVGLSVEDCVDWGRCVIQCYKMMKKTKKALVAVAGSTIEDNE